MTEKEFYSMSKEELLELEERELMEFSIESTKEFKEAMKKIQPILDKEFEGPYRCGKCHFIWARKKQLLREYGIDWKTPSERFPHMLFD